jgi:4a-hydroxytetrahydrobiopterin dehydratase
MSEQLTPSGFLQSEGVEDWRVVSDGGCAFFRTASLAESAGLVDAMARVPGLEDHSPDVDLRHDGVTVRLVTVTDDYS